MTDNKYYVKQPIFKKCQYSLNVLCIVFTKLQEGFGDKRGENFSLLIAKSIANPDSKILLNTNFYK